MEIQITGKAIDLGAALQSHVRGVLTQAVEKYFDRTAEAQVVFDKEGPEHRVEITLHLASGVYLAAQDRAHDAYGAFDGAAAKLEKRLRRYKRRLKDHHSTARDPLPAETASYNILSIPGLDDDKEVVDEAPLVIAEQTKTLRRMSVSDAVLQLDVTDDKVVIFRNAKHGDLNVVYQREDGNIGWIDGGRTAD